MVELLLSQGANIHDRENNGHTPIVVACAMGHLPVVELLISRGADIQDKNNFGQSSIVVAACEGHLSVVKLLLSKGANIHDRGNFGETPIILASRGNHLSVVEFLLSNGASVFDGCEEWPSPLFASFLNKPVNVEVPRMLLLHGAYIRDIDRILTLDRVSKESKELASYLGDLWPSSLLLYCFEIADWDLPTEIIEMLVHLMSSAL